MRKSTKDQQALAKEIMEMPISKCREIKENAEARYVCPENGTLTGVTKRYYEVIQLMKVILEWLQILFQEAAFQDTEWVIAHREQIPDPVEILRECAVYREKHRDEEIMALSTAFYKLGVAERVYDQIYEDRDKGWKLSSQSIISALTSDLRRNNEHEAYIYEGLILRKAIEGLEDEVLKRRRNKQHLDDLNLTLEYARQKLVRIGFETESARVKGLHYHCNVLELIEGLEEHGIITQKEQDTLIYRYIVLRKGDDGLYKLSSWRNVGKKIGTTEAAVRKMHDQAVEKIAQAVNQGKIAI